MRAIIFGASGQDGYYLIQACQGLGLDATGVSRTDADVIGDVRDTEFVMSIIKNMRPHFVFHLAATSTTRHDAILENQRTICTGTINVLEAVRLHSPDCRVFITGSGLQFVNDGAPICGSEPWALDSAYAVQRTQSVLAARYYRRLGVRTYVGYLFHHESPKRGMQHVAQKIAVAARQIGAGGRERLEIGDLSVVKEWTFAGDVVRAILALVQQDSVHEAVIGSGDGRSIRQWLGYCFSAVGKDWRDHVEERGNYQAEYKRLISNPSVIRSLGWCPSVSPEALAAMMVHGDTESFPCQ